MRRFHLAVKSLALLTLASGVAFAQGPSAKKAEKREEKQEHADFKAARSQHKKLLKGIKLTEAQEKQAKAVAQKYEDQYKSLEKQERDADQAKQPSAQFMTQLQQLREQERAELRGILTPDQVARFDANVAGKRKKG